MTQRILSGRGLRMKTQEGSKKELLKEDKPREEETPEQMEAYVKFNDRYEKLIEVFRKEIPEDQLGAVAEESVNVVELWNNQRSDVQNALQRETILHGLTQYMYSDELPIQTKLKVIKGCLGILVHLNLSSVVEKEANDNIVTPKQTLNNSKLVL